MSSDSHTPSRDELAQTYLSITRPGSEAINRFLERAERWHDQTTNEEVANDAAPAIAAIREVDDKLLRINWPTEIAADVKELVRADCDIVRDLSALVKWTCCRATGLSSSLRTPGRLPPPSTPFAPGWACPPGATK
jgi:hypothetical protein